MNCQIMLCQAQRTWPSPPRTSSPAAYPRPPAPSQMHSSEFVTIGEQVYRNSYIDNEDGDTERPGPLVNLVAFQRDQRAGRKDRQEGSPAPSGQEPDALERMQRGVKESTGLDQMKLPGLKAGDPGNGTLKEPVLGIEVKVANDLFEACGHIALEKPEETKPHRHSEHGSDQLQHADNLDPQGTLEPARDQSFLPSICLATRLHFDYREMSNPS